MAFFMELCIALPSSAKARETRYKSVADCAKSVLIKADVLLLSCCDGGTSLMEAIKLGATASSAVVAALRYVPAS